MTLPRAPISQQAFQAEWHLVVRSSPLLTGFILLTHGLSMVSISLLSLVWWMKVASGLLILGSLSYHLLQQLAYWPMRSVAEVKWREFGGWELLTRDGKGWSVRLLDNSFSSLYLTILNFKAARGQRFSVILTPDVLPMSQARHLRRRLALLH